MDKAEFYTVKEIADSLGVTVQTVYKYVKEIDKKHIKKIKNVTQIDAPGKELIQNLYLKANNGNVIDTSKSLVDNLERYISTLEEQIKIKDEQIKNKDEQLTSLADRIKESNLILYQHGIALEGNIEEAETIETIIDTIEVDDISPNNAAETQVEETEYKEIPKYSSSLLNRLKFLFTGKLEDKN